MVSFKFDIIVCVSFTILVRKRTLLLRQLNVVISRIGSLGNKGEIHRICALYVLFSG